MDERCVFCAGSLAGVAQGEHIFPQWLLKHLGVPKSDRMFQSVAAATASLDATGKPERVHGTWSFLEGRVCTDCNTGWMEHLEDKARPTLKKLMDGRGELLYLNQDERVTVTKWSAKTAFLVANVAPFKHPVPSGHLKALNGEDGQVPAGVQVFAAQVSSPTKSSYIQSMNWEHIYSSKAPIVGGAVGAYKIGIQFGNLLIVVAYSPSSFAQFATAAGIHIPLNPKTMVWPCYFYTPRVLPSVELPLWTFTRSLALAMGTN